MKEIDLNKRRKIMEASHEYEIFKRLRNLDFTWNICSDNRNELFDIIDKLEQTVNMLLYDIYNGVISLMTRRLINHVGTVSLLVDHMRNENNFLKKKGIDIGYDEKVNEYFFCNPNTQFVHGLRNYIIHNRIIKPEIESYVVSEELNVSILTLKTGELLKSDKWNKYAKEYINKNYPKINLRTCLINYFDQQNTFYNWFKSEYRNIFVKEITYCENIINEWNNMIDEKRKEIDGMSFDKLMSLPRLVCTSENGFSITRIE